MNKFTPWFPPRTRMITLHHPRARNACDLQPYLPLDFISPKAKPRAEYMDFCKSWGLLFFNLRQEEYVKLNTDLA